MGKFLVLFTDKLWSIDTTGESRFYKNLVTFVKLVRITINRHIENRMGFQCVALSYYVALAFIPLLAFIFAVSGGLGLDGIIDSFLLSLSSDVDASLLNVIREKAGNIIDIAESGGVGLIAALSFIWTILWMMFQVERVFNNVWGVRKIPRKIYKRFGFYLIVLILVPFVVIIFSAGIAYYSNFSKFLGLDLSGARFIAEALGYLTFYGVALLTLYSMYRFIPATEVKHRNAMRSAALAALAFVVFQYLYLETQMFVAKLNMVYGVLAAIPLFLIYLNYSWQIIIYGAELTYAYQNIESYGLEDSKPLFKFKIKKQPK